MITAALLLTFLVTALASCMDQPGTVTDNTAAAGTKDTDAETVTVPETDEITDETTKTGADATAAETDADTAAEETESETTAKETEADTTAKETEAETTAEETPADTSAEGQTDPSAALGSFDEFDSAFMEFIEKTEDGNYMISPLSFKYALGMAMAGADGDTLKQFLTGFGISDLSAYENYIKAFNSFEEGFTEKVKRDLDSYDEAIRKGADKNYLEYRPGSLRTANSVWKREDLADFAKEYKLHLEMYNAEHYTFTPADIVDRANEWANKKTEGMIPEILSNDYDTTNLAVVLMNALYYKNCWKNEFNKCGEMPFTTADGAVLKKNFITSTETYKYYKDDKTELVVIGMNNNVDMVIVTGDTADLQNKINKAKNRKVRVYIPELEIETSLENKELCNFLLSLGITDAFSPYVANFGRMTETGNDFYIDDIIQKAKIKLDETGVEAAAVTAIMMKNESADPENPIEFKADKPFRFYITTAQSEWTETSGITLFEGRYCK